MRSQFILFSVVIYVCAYNQDKYTSDVSYTNENELTKVESLYEPKNNITENSIEALSKHDAPISVTIKSDLSSKQNLTTANLFETNKNITSSSQESNKLNGSLLKNPTNNTTNGASHKTNMNEVEKNANDLIINATNDFSSVNNIENTSQTSPDSLNKNNHDNSTTNENTIEHSPLNNSLRNEINISDENLTIDNTTINDHLKKKLSNSTIESNHTKIQRLTERSKESDAYNYTTHNDSVTTVEYLHETFLSKDSNNTEYNDESTSEDNTFGIDIGDIIFDDVSGEEEEEEEEDDDDDTSSSEDADDDQSESDKSTTTIKAVKDNNKKLNQNSKGLGIFTKFAIFSINVAFVFVAFWLTKTFIDKRVFHKVFSINIPPNGYVVGHSEIFLHKSVQVFILKQPFTENHKTTEYLGVWLF